MTTRAPNTRIQGTHVSPLRVSVLASLLVLSLSACSSKEEGGAAGPATQVAAKVGDSEISVHQINQVLGRTQMKDPSKEALQAASSQILERLIDQQLAVDGATKDNLHRTPEVISALEAARRDVLARAYLQKFAATVAKATPEEVAQYYREHPALFSERRVFNLQEIRMPDVGAVLPELRTLAEQGKRIEDIAAFLRDKQVPFTGGGAARPAEQLPLELLPKIHALKDGENLIITTGKGATLVRVAGSQQAPVAEDKARPAIEQFLNNRRVNEAVAAEMKRMREATTVAYMGEFNKPAGAAGTPAAGAAATSVTTEAPAAAAPANLPAPAAPAAPASADQDALQRGIQGLK